METISLTKIFGDWWGRAKVIAVDKLDLKIRYNEIYGLLGPNGSGKTTTLKMLLNLLHPTKGRALVLGGSSRNSRISERIGYLPEDSYLYRYLTARETLDFYGRIFGLPSSVRKSRIDALLEMVGLTGMANRAVGTYSKGMARRIGLAQALINDPEILILDEPTSGMDPIGTRQIKDLLLKLAKRGKTILLCSHLLADVEDVCDRIGILYGGRMQVEGTVAALLQHRDEKQILTGSISAAALEKIGRIIENEQASYTVNSPMDRLEEFFIRTVASAQKQELPTSGAMSTTSIGGFLTEESDKPGILDQLVTAGGDQPAGGEDVEILATQTPAESTSPQPADSGLLEKL
ncbi:MAG: ABC transporter ATP-binding protein, partial [Planctomycetota bacterium]